jgi:CO/xanthine dehydrogenase FAD-binding subunit
LEDGCVYHRPVDLDQALEALCAHRPVPIAGGTDFYPARVGRALDSEVLDLSRIEGMRGLSGHAEGWRIGALTTWSDLARADLPEALRALRQAALEVGGLQVQNRGTVGGNLCNASPAADGVPVLLALDASVELASRRGTRRLPLAEFVLGPRRTALAPDELLVAIHLPAPVGTGRSRFLKLGHRRYLVISIAMVAVSVDTDPRGCVRRIGVAVGACGPVARRLPALESALLGAPVERLAEHAGPVLADGRALEPLSPIDDVRGTAHFRCEVASTLVRRALSEVAA